MQQNLAKKRLKKKKQMQIAARLQKQRAAKHNEQAIDDKDSQLNNASFSPKKSSSMKLKRKSTSMLTGSRKEGFGGSEADFVSKGASNGYFVAKDAMSAIEVFQQSFNSNSGDMTESGRNLLKYSQNTLKILLGLALVHDNQYLFDSITQQLGAEALDPFSSDFKQCKGDFDDRARKLLELALKACLVAGSYQHAEQVLHFAKGHNYLLALEEQIVYHLVKQTQYEQAMFSDY